MLVLLNRNITLRDTLTFKYEIAVTFKKILINADLPYSFDQVNKKWWRYCCELYGFFYSRTHRSYTIWLSNGLKKNIGLYMPFLMKIPSKKSKPYSSWKRRTFLYKESINLKKDWKNPKFFKKLNLTNFNFFLASKNTLYSKFLNNNEHYAYSSYGSFGLDEENLISGYNAKWHDIYRYWSGFYKLTGQSPNSFLVGVNNFYVWSSFFINLFDSTITLYPEHYLVYHNNIFIKDIYTIVTPYITTIVNFLILNFSNLYKNLLILLFSLFKKIFNEKFILLFSFKYNNNIIYKLNLTYILYYYYILYNLKYNNNINNSLLFNTFQFFKKTKLKKYINNTYFKYVNYSENIKNKYLFDFKFYYYLNNNKIFMKYYFCNIKYKNKLNRKKKYKIFKNKIQTLFFINLYKSLWTLNFLLLNKNPYYNFNKHKTFKKYIINYSLLKFKIKMILNIKRILTYGKLFLRIPAKFLKYKFKINKASSIITNFNLFRSFLLIFNKKSFVAKIVRFNYKFFTLILHLIKINFGFSFLSFKNDKKENFIEKDNLFFCNLKYYLFKYLSFINIFFKKNINNKIIFFKKNNFYSKIIFNIINYKKIKTFIKKIKLLTKKKLRYFDYCYRGNNIKLLKK